MENGCQIPAKKAMNIAKSYFRDTCVYQPTATGTAIASLGAGQLGPGEVVAAPGGDDQNSSLNKTTLMTGLVSAKASLSKFEMLLAGILAYMFTSGWEEKQVLRSAAYVSGEGLILTEERQSTKTKR